MTGSTVFPPAGRDTGVGLDSLVRGICFKTGPPRTVGVEVEWLVHEAGRPHIPIAPARFAAVRAALGALPLRSAFTVEPGGQLELSSPPASSLMACVSAVSADLAAVRGALRPMGLVLTGLGTDPWRPPVRLLREPRYDALESCLDRAGPEGRAMMCSSASVQVCVDAGHEAPGPLGHARRWRLAHLLGPVLVAAFANSPLLHGEATGWRSTRQLLWAEIDPGRSAAPDLTAEPRAAWAARALAAPVMCVRADDDGPWLVPEGLSFLDWARGGRPRPPTRADLDYHLSTLFPPVRPRGHLELRMIDAQPGDDGWIVPLAVVCALFDDPAAAETAYRVVKPLAERAGPKPPPADELWRAAARDAMTDPELHEAAVDCFAAAREALPRLGASPAVRRAVDAYTERHVTPGRSPADEFADALASAARPASDQFTVQGKDVTP
ncbi:ergothioneine biosynthesis glutamate--cysteine ligase EgtA [Streptomyces sp. NPDC050560]|uniref:ergothioneine biosynthesis glutamate--cysteine ligase EgtA n=1 Tax=Streptomyces sp. NPDC050560 TaxID=3365630 RepID=UPI003790BBF1